MQLLFQHFQLLFQHFQLQFQLIQSEENVCVYSLLLLCHFMHAHMFTCIGYARFFFKNVLEKRKIHIYYILKSVFYHYCLFCYLSAPSPFPTQNQWFRLYFKRLTITTVYVLSVDFVNKKGGWGGGHWWPFTYLQN